MEAFNHFKPIVVAKGNEDFLGQDKAKEPGVLVENEKDYKKILDMLAKHRFWERNIY